MSIKERFDSYCSLVKMLTKRPSDKDLLYLYGMYKQATEGDYNTKEPSLLNMKEHAKWTSWRNNEGIEKSVAMAFYIAKVDEIFTKQKMK